MHHHVTEGKRTAEDTETFESASTEHSNRRAAAPVPVTHDRPHEQKAMVVLFAAGMKVGTADTAADLAVVAAVVEVADAAVVGEEAMTAVPGGTASVEKQTVLRMVADHNRMGTVQVFVMMVESVHPSRPTWVVPVGRRLRNHLRRVRRTTLASCMTPCRCLKRVGMDCNPGMRAGSLC
jgi:hypothetical protein